MESDRAGNESRKSGQRRIFHGKSSQGWAAACLVIVSEEASDNTRKMFTNMCTYYRVPIYFLGTKSELGHAMGKEFRASLALRDEGFAKAVVKQMNINGGSRCES